MKKILKTILVFASIFTLCSCDDFLDRQSKTVMDDGNYWSNEANVRLFVDGAYGTYFTGYSSVWGSVYAPAVFGGEFSDDKTTGGTQGNILISVPTDNWRVAEDVSGNWLRRRVGQKWNFAYVRKWNLLIERLEMMKEKGVLDSDAYNHWSGVAHFFRGWEYSRLVCSFGDVPYYDHTIAAEDIESQYIPRTPRSEVMTHVLEDFQYAFDNVRLNDGLDYVNKDVVATIASRFMLFEGTWYLYHKNDEAMKTCSDIEGNAKKFLEAAKKFAGSVIEGGRYQFDTPFRELFGHLYDRLNSKEVLIYRVYNKERNWRCKHCIASYANGDEGQAAAGNLATLKAFICNDGKPYNESSVENAESFRLQEMVKTRDPRFESSFWDEPKGNSSTGLYCEKFIDRKGVTYHYNGLPRPSQYGSCTNENGYPCVRYAETVLNYIEAKAELADKFGGAAVTQEDLDKTINAIRTRPLDEVAEAKGVKKTAPLQISNLPNDPERTSDAIHTTLGYKTCGEISPLIWEIRRERRMEFFLEQVRPRDIRRWGQLELMLCANNPDLGVGGYVELDLAATINEGSQAKVNGRAPQKTNLKKTKSNTGYNLLTIGNKDKIKVMPIIGYNPDGTLKLGSPIAWNCEVGKITIEEDGKQKEVDCILNGNFEEMRGFYVPRNFADRDPRNVDVRNYLEPICTDIINEYANKGFEIKQNPGW